MSIWVVFGRAGTMWGELSMFGTLGKFHYPDCERIELMMKL